MTAIIKPVGTVVVNRRLNKPTNTWYLSIAMIVIEMVDT